MRYYDVYLDQRVVGKAEVEEEGLYYRIRCQCELHGEEIYKLMISTGAEPVLIGVCAPQGRFFGLDRKIPIKRVGKEIRMFYVVLREEETCGIFVPLSADRPFDAMENLCNARFRIRDGVPGLVISQQGDVNRH